MVFIMSFRYRWRDLAALGGQKGNVAGSIPGRLAADAFMLLAYQPERDGRVGADDVSTCADARNEDSDPVFDSGPLHGVACLCQGIVHLDAGRVFPASPGFPKTESIFI